MSSIRIIMGPCQSFEPAAIIRATGARGTRTRGKREFVIDGPMSVDQVAALLQLTRLEPSDDQVTITTDPPELFTRDGDDLCTDEELNAWWQESIWSR